MTASRRDFLKAAATVGSSAFLHDAITSTILRAAHIAPDPGTTFHDAEHVVILMQENRSFDHAYGCLRGVRGYRDPRPFELPSGHSVWMQADDDGSIVPPFRLEMDKTKITWMGGTPHSWPDQVDARNAGKYDKWLQAKRRGDNFPMTMGYFTREDIPFYYALADCFTIFDYAFCSSLTGTTPNRLYLWSGTVRESADHPARVLNSDTDYEDEASWTTYPERLQSHGISWKVYQNELSLGTGFDGEHDAWLANFTDNPLEWMSQYRVRFSPKRREFVKKEIERLEAIIAKGEGNEAQLTAHAKMVENYKKEASIYSEEAWQALDPRERDLHQRGFADNAGDPDYRTIVEYTYDDNGTARTTMVPKGDVLHQFRKDVEAGELPSVSWLVPPERFSDHPGSAWFGAWFLSEAINILTQDPEVWKKTIFILCYDENDGFFDHIPPFIAPHPDRPETGKTSKVINTADEIAFSRDREHSIGLGYRCPLVIASPWTRGGAVNSQITDHTSILMFLEQWLAGKGKDVPETNISKWRRTVCGDLTSAFRPFDGEKVTLPEFLDRDDTIERIHKARFQDNPGPAPRLTADTASAAAVAALQEPGTRPSCPLPYELEANIAVGANGAELTLQAGNKRLGAKAAGGAFMAYSYGPEFVSRAYAVVPGDTLSDVLPVGDEVHVRIDGPNGFLRQLKSKGTPRFSVMARAEGDNLVLEIQNPGSGPLEVKLLDESYGQDLPMVRVPAQGQQAVTISTAKSAQWYDVSVTAGAATYRFAGRVETGRWTTSDPAM
ncbi:MAG: phosphocholine-specific phospholipase C [Armatimonadota bacterium]|nr:phospholipase C, phosphocholine-specific [Fimbriimonadaceae bacterium]MCZ8137763.1 phospholipase C, phosphocholine-specific [Fimbriimonadaceae bacterium]